MSFQIKVKNALFCCKGFLTVLILFLSFIAARSDIRDASWDAVVKEIAVSGEVSAVFYFNLTNLSGKDIRIDKVTPSCGCTVASLPAQPWVLPPGGNGQLKFSTDLRGKTGSFSKTATVVSSAGTQVLTMKVIMPDANAKSLVGSVAASPARVKNQELAKVDHQAVFKNDCASCHLTPASGKMGLELYTVACGICHDAEHRAQAVPTLGTSALAANPAYWRTWITFGKPGSMMPAFAKSLGGPLESTQIESLSSFLASRHGTNETVKISNQK